MWPCVALPEVQKFTEGRSGCDLGCADRCLEGAEGFDKSTGLDASDLSEWEDGKWEYVFSSHCLEHIVDWRHALSEWMRVVADRGFLILYLPCRGYYPGDGNPDHKNELAPWEIIHFIEADKSWRMIECFWPDHPMGDAHSSFLVVARKLGESYNPPYLSREYDISL